MNVSYKKPITFVEINVYVRKRIPWLKVFIFPFPSFFKACSYVLRTSQSRKCIEKLNCLQLLYAQAWVCRIFKRSVVFIFTRQWKLLTLVFTANLCTTLLLSFCYCRCLRMPVLLLPKPSGNIWTCILRGGRGPESRSYDVGPLDQARNCASDEPWLLSCGSLLKSRTQRVI